MAQAPPSPDLQTLRVPWGLQLRRGTTIATCPRGRGRVHQGKAICSCAHRPVGAGGRYEEAGTSTPQVIKVHTSTSAHLSGFQVPRGLGLLMVCHPLCSAPQGWERLCRGREVNRQALCPLSLGSGARPGRSAPLTLPAELIGRSEHSPSCLDPGNLTASLGGTSEDADLSPSAWATLPPAWHTRSPRLHWTLPVTRAPSSPTPSFPCSSPHSEGLLLGSPEHPEVMSTWLPLRLSAGPLSLPECLSLFICTPLVTFGLGSVTPQ